MKHVICALFVLALAAALAVHFSIPTTDAQSTGCTDQALALAEGQLTDTLAYTNTSLFPEETNPTNSNKWNLRDVTHWTSGFFPGELWIMYEKTLSSSWLSRAQAWTATMQSQDTNAPDHDIGFKILGTYGNAYRITRDPADMAVIQAAANAMATNLWRPQPGVIESWPNHDIKGDYFTVIIDNMMNLELLLFAAQNGGDPLWRDMAVRHAVQTRLNHVRPDGSTYHVVGYDETNGSVAIKYTAQGFSDTSTWSRGQAWGLNGFTMVYRYTKNDPNVPPATSASFLATAQQLADYFINGLPPDYVPYWDFTQSGNAPRDSSAAAIAAAGLLDLSTQVKTQAESLRYRTAALNILSSLSSPAYLGNRAATDGILLHGTSNAPGGDTDKSLIYGDYYFLQGCYRARSVPPAPLNVSAAASSVGQVNLTWTAQSGPIRYSVKRSSTSGGPYTIIAPPPVLTANSYTDTNAAPGTNFYVVSAINASGESADSAQVSASITSAPTTTSLTSSANPSVYGKSVTFTATIHPPTSGTPTGTVTFKDGAATLATVTLTGNSASFSTTTLAAQTHSIVATYNGDANFSASNSPILTETITKATTSIVLTSSPYASRYGQPVAFYAAVKSGTSGTPTGTVTFKDGSTIMGTGSLSLGHAKFTTLKLTVGTHSLTAVYAGDANFAGSTSAVLTFVTSKAASSTTIVSSLNPSKHGTAVTFTATVKPSTTGTPTGSATFKDGTVVLGTIALTSGKATFTTSTLATGSHSITATYNGSTGFNPSTSATLIQTVN
jgi:hypothetical protein